MLNVLWLILLVGSAAFALATGNTKAVTHAATEGAGQAVKIAIGLLGVMTLWLGIMKIAEDSGLVGVFTRLIRPALTFLFPGVPPEHPAMGSMAMNMAANMFGLNNAATPLGLKAMADLNTLNDTPGTATDEMCMFLAINTSSIQLIPAGAIALLAGGGASDPTIIVVPAILATMFSTLCGVTAAKILARSRRYRKAKTTGSSS